MEEIVYRLKDGDEALEEIRVEEGVTTLPDHAFRRAAALKRLYLPISVVRLGHGLFEGLADIDIYYGGSAESWRRITEDIREERDIYHEGKYDHQPFNSGFGSYYSKTVVLIHFDYRAKNLCVHTADGEEICYNAIVDAEEELKLHPSVKTIAYDTVRNKESLRAVRIPETVTRLGDEAFAYAEELCEVYIPDSVEFIDRRAFFGCTALKRVRLPKGVKHIGTEAFCCCRALSEINLPEGLITLGDYALSDTALTEVRLPLSIENLGAWAFASSKELTKVDIPDGLVKLPRYIFTGCTELKAITLPETVMKIEPTATVDSAVEVIYYRGETPPKFVGGAAAAPKGLRLEKLN